MNPRSSDGRRLAAGRVLLPHPLEHQHVGVDGHADREHEPGDPGQGQGGAQGQQHGERDQPVADQGHRGQPAEQPVEAIMNSIVRAAPSTAACTLASMAASPRVGPTVRCSTTSTGTGRAPARMSSARSPASSPVKSPVITVWPPPMPCSQATEGSTWGLEITWPSSTMATRRVGSPSCWQAASPVSAAQRRPPSPWKLDRDLPAGLELGVELGAGVPDRVPGEGGRAEPQPGAVLVGQHQVSVAGRRGGRGRFAGGGLGQAQHRVEGELGRPADDLDGLLGVVDAGQLHDHPPLARALQARLGHPQLVDPVAQHLKGAGHGVAVDLPFGAVLGFEDDLGAAAQVKAELRVDRVRGQPPSRPSTRRARTRRTRAARLIRLDGLRRGRSLSPPVVSRTG